MAHTEYYELLGVDVNATEEEIKRAYKKAAVRIHPDKNPNDPQAAEAFQELSNAYSVLLDADSRATYDRYGPEGLKRGGGGGGPGPSMDEFFSSFFTFQSGFGPGAGAPRRKKRGEDSVIPYDVTLEDLYNGKTAHFNLERNVICSHCTGTGGRSKAKPSKCIKCDGRGTTMATQNLGGGRMAQMRVPCPDCEGTGSRFKEKDRCKKCKGNKTTKEKKAVDLTIERGMSHNQKIILKGEGDQQPGIETGDVVFILRLQPHETFHRSPSHAHPTLTSTSAASADLFTTVHLTLSEALLGFSRVVLRHLDGRGIHMSRQAASDPATQLEGQGLPVRHGDLVVIRGDGMPVYDPARVKRRDTRGKAGNDDDLQKGDLYISFELEMPTAEWLAGIDKKALESLLPPKKPELSPVPEKVTNVSWEAADPDELSDENWEDEGSDDESHHHGHNHSHGHSHSHKGKRKPTYMDDDYVSGSDDEAGEFFTFNPFGGGMDYDVEELDEQFYRAGAGGGGQECQTQ